MTLAYWRKIEVSGAPSSFDSIFFNKVVQFEMAHHTITAPYRLNYSNMSVFVFKKDLQSAGLSPYLTYTNYVPMMLK